MGRSKNNKGVVFSTDPEFNFNQDSNQEESISPEEQTLYVSVDNKKRKGKVVTLVEGFIGAPEDLKDLEKLLKSKCGVGGSSKDGIIIIQGTQKQKIGDLLQAEGYTVRYKG